MGANAHVPPHPLVKLAVGGVVLWAGFHLFHGTSRWHREDSAFDNSGFGHTRQSIHGFHGLQRPLPPMGFSPSFPPDGTMGPYYQNSPGLYLYPYYASPLHPSPLPFGSCCCCHHYVHCCPPPCSHGGKFDKERVRHRQSLPDTIGEGGRGFSLRRERLHDKRCGPDDANKLMEVSDLSASKA